VQIETIQTPTAMDLAVDRVRRAKDKAEVAAQELKDSQRELMALLAVENVKTHVYDGYQATVVRNTGYTFNEAGLRKAVGARVYNKLTTAKLDSKKLEKAVEDGVIDPVLVAQYATEKKTDPFLRLTEKK
jgi:predicted amidohydrolase